VSLERELARKLLHVSTAVVPVAYAAEVPRVVVVGALAALASVALVVELARRSGRGAAHFTRTTGALLREHEHAGAWAGATWLLLAFLLAVLVFPPAVAVAAMLGVSLGDAAGAVVGRWWGTRRARRTRGTSGVPAMNAGAPPRNHDGASAAGVHHQASAGRSVAPPTDVSPPVAPVASVAPAPPLGIASSSKTWVGTAACAIATTIGALLVARLGVVESVLAGALAAAAERPAWRFDDNLRIVLAVGGGILLCRLAFS
jgi:dolichol kinase